MDRPQEVKELVGEFRQEIRDGADTAYLSQVIGSYLERAYKAGQRHPADTGTSRPGG
jgi:hypothetical protein